MRSLAVSLLLATFSLNANALSILLTGDHPGRDPVARLVELGHTVTQQSANQYWDNNYDYSVYDVVAFVYGSSDPREIDGLVAAVQAGEVGVVFFRGWGADATAKALGIMSDGILDWQYAYNNLNVVNNNHYITQGAQLGQHDLGYTYMSYVASPGADTTVLAKGGSGAALVVHNSLRVAVTPFYGHEAGFDDETAFGMELTERTLQWAAGATTVVPIPAAVWLFASGLGLLGWLRHRPAT